MKLHDLFAHMRPMFVGTATAEETAEAVYGEAATGVHGRRLALYDTLEPGRARELRLAFPACAQVVGEAWPALAAAYYRTTPWGAYDWAPAGDGFAAYLLTHDVTRDRPWLAEVATLEWALFNQPPIGVPTRDGPLRVGDGVRVLELTADIARWFVGRDRTSPPAARPGCAVIWTTPAEVAIVTPLDDAQRALFAQLAAGEVVLENIPASLAAVADTIERFSRAGILAGSLADVELPPVDVRSPPVVTVGRDLEAQYQLLADVTSREVDGAIQICTADGEAVMAGSDARLARVVEVFKTLAPLREILALLATEVDAMTTVEIADALLDIGLLTRA